MYFPPEITKEFILDRVGEEEIFSYYGVPVVNYPFRSPLRDDRNPTCTMYRSRKNNKLYMRDWAGYFWGDCFDLVMHIFGINYYDALKKIALDFHLIQTSSAPAIERKPAPQRIEKQMEYVDIRVKRRAWNKEDVNFWKRWDFKMETLELFRVSPAERIWLNGRPHYIYRKEDPAYIYNFYGYDYKIYFPYRESHRFLHNNPEILQGFIQLPDKGRYVLITKSYKDVMKLYEFGIPSVAPMSESMILSNDQFNHLSGRFSHIFSLYDTDRTGVVSMQKMKKQFGIKPLFFPRSLPTKDFTDFYEQFGQEDTNLLVSNTKEFLF